MDIAVQCFPAKTTGTHYQYITITDPIPDDIDGSSAINKVLDEAIRGIISIDELRYWADELDRNGFCELSYEICHRLGGH